MKNDQWLFTFNIFGSSNGLINSVVVQSVKVYNNKLFVLVNNSHKIHIYNINSDGLQII